MRSTFSAQAAKREIESASSSSNKAKCSPSSCAPHTCAKNAKPPPPTHLTPLENEACGTYKYMAVNKATNPYLESIVENLEKRRGKLAECAK